MLAFVFTLPKVNIRVFTICKTIFILNWTKSEYPNFRVLREMEVQFCWKVETGLGKIDLEPFNNWSFWPLCLWNHQTFVAYFINSVQIITVTVCLICICHYHRQRGGRWCSCLTYVRKQPHSWSFFVWHIRWAEVIPWTCLRVAGWLFIFSWAKKRGPLFPPLIFYGNTRQCNGFLSDWPEGNGEQSEMLPS